MIKKTRAPHSQDVRGHEHVTNIDIQVRPRPKGGIQRGAGLYKPPAPGPLGSSGNPLSLLAAADQRCSGVCCPPPWGAMPREPPRTPFIPVSSGGPGGEGCCEVVLFFGPSQRPFPCEGPV